MKNLLHILVLSFCIISGLLYLLQLAGVVSAAPAAVITVNTTSDEVANNGQCSLRKAITAANNGAGFNGCPAASGANTIVLPAGVYKLTITGTGEINNSDGDLDIFSSVVISGAGADQTFIEAGPTFNEGLVHVHGGPDPAQSVTLLGVTLRNSPAVGIAALWNNSPLLVISASAILSSSGSFAGAIHNQGNNLAIINSRIAGNTSNGPGGINDVGMVTVTNSTVAGNASLTSAGGIYSQGTLTVMSSTIAHNGGHSGGGLEIANGTPNLIFNTTISANHAISYAGGLFNAFGLVTISNSIVISNDAPLGGGLGNAGNMHVLSSQIMSNTAARGGGIGNALVIDVQDSEIAYNQASDIGGGVGNDGGTSYGFGFAASATFENTTIEHNTAPRGAGIGQAGYLTMRDGILQYNVASVRGGGMSIGNGVTLVSGTHILNNSAPTGAGVFHTYEAQYGTLGTNSTFSTTVIQGNASGGITVVTGTLRITKSTLSGNAPNCSITGGTVTSGGGNTSSDLSCASRFTASGDINGLLIKLFLPLILR